MNKQANLVMIRDPASLNLASLSCSKPLQSSIKE